MIRSFRFAYALAKAYGMVSRSWVGRNYEDLLRLRRLEEFSRRLFPADSAGGEPPGPDEMEQRIVQEAVRAMIRILSLLGGAPEVLVHFLRFYEYQSVKSVIRSLVNTSAGRPRIWDIGPYRSVRLAPEGNLQEALASSPYAWAAAEAQAKPLFEIESVLDRDYYERLLSLARALPRADRRGVERLVSLETALANVTWALRMRFFFGVDAQAAQGLLIPGVSLVHHRAAEEVFEIPADSIDGWRRWKFAWLLEDQLSESFRAPDPVRAEQKAARRLYVRAHQLLHEDPFTLTPFAAFLRLKQFEASMLVTAVEGVRLSIPEQEMMSLAGGA